MALHSTVDISKIKVKGNLMAYLLKHHASWDVSNLRLTQSQYAQLQDEFNDFVGLPPKVGRITKFAEFSLEVVDDV